MRATAAADRIDPTSDAQLDTPLWRATGENIGSQGPARNRDDPLHSLPYPDFEQYGSRTVAAAAARQAGRANAASTSDAEVRRLLRERKELLDRVLSGVATRSEQNKLAYVRWQLDRIDDARVGPNLDRLEASISVYEDISEQIGSLVNALNRQAPGGKSDGKGRRRR